MKKILILAFLAMSFVACKKNTSTSGTVDYSGTYKGEIKVYMNGTLTNTLSDYSMGFAQGVGGYTTITNNVFGVTTGKISGNTLVLDKKTIATSPTYNTVQSGTAVFGASSVSIQFKEEEIDMASNAVLNTKLWSGTLNIQ